MDPSSVITKKNVQIENLRKKFFIVSNGFCLRGPKSLACEPCREDCHVEDIDRHLNSFVPITLATFTITCKLKEPRNNMVFEP